MLYGVVLVHSSCAHYKIGFVFCIYIKKKMQTSRMAAHIIMQEEQVERIRFKSHYLCVRAHECSTNVPSISKFNITGKYDTPNVERRKCTHYICATHILLHSQAGDMATYLFISI